MTPRAIDGRRATDIRVELAASAAALVPEWTGANDPGDFGAALYEIASRLAEHTTRRLDKTPDRDRLAFYETLSLSGGAPRAARVPIAFTLADKRDERVDLPAAVQVAAQLDDRAVPFETEEVLQITPARIGVVVVADPAADRLEMAPVGVHSGKPRLAYSPAYKTASASVAGSQLLQLATTVGLQPKDLLRIGDRVCEIQSVKDDLVTLTDVLEVFVPSDFPITKIENLEAFSLRNVQEHCVYVGHKDLLKLDAPATITLSIEPPGLASRLVSMDVSFALWGTKQGEKDPAWQPLGVGSAASGHLRLIKSWGGSVDELEINGRKSRWLRVRLDAPMGRTSPATLADLIAIRVASQPNDPATVDRTVTAAYHNGVPLSASGPFLPFGPEPQRFDTFAIAAPETLSKKGASAWLEITLADAFPVQLALVSGRSNRAYAIGADGRLHVLTFATDTVDWRRIDDQPVSPSAGGTPNSLTLSDTLPIYAAKASQDHDLVIAADKQGQITRNLIYWRGDIPVSGGWTRLLAPVGASTPPWKDFTVIQPNLPTEFLAQVIAANADGILSCGIRFDDSGGTTAWTKLDDNALSGINFAESVKLAPGLAAEWPGPGRASMAAVTAVDGNGGLYRGLLDLAGKTVRWRNCGWANPRTRPFLIEDGNGHLLAAADPQQQLFAIHVPAASTKPLITYELPSVEVASNSVLTGFREIDQENPDDLGIAAWDAAGLIFWIPNRPAIRFELQASGVDPDSPSGLLARVGNETLMVLAGKPETLFIGKLPEFRSRPVSLRDWVRSKNAVDVVAIGDLPAEVLPVRPTPLADDDGDYFAVSGGKLKDQEFRLCTSNPRPPFKGTLSDETKLTRSTGDVVAPTGHIIVGNRLHEITSHSPTECEFTPKTTEALGPVDYEWARAGSVRQATDAQVQTLVECNFSASKHVQDIFFDASANPQKPAVVFQNAPGSDIWLLLSDAWNDQPTSLIAQLVFEGAEEFSYPFPRGYQNPELAWEYSDGIAWRHIAVEDETANLARSGRIRFLVPADLSATDVAGKTDLWIRARLIGGDYGRAKYVVTTVPIPPKTKQSIEIDTSELHPPEIKTIKARYRLDDEAAPQYVLAQNNRALLDQTQAALEGGAHFDLFAGIPLHTAIAAGGSDPASGRAIYLRLSKAPDVDVLNVYVDAVERDAPAATVSAEVLTLAGWAALAGFADETAGLLRPGMLRLPLNPTPIKAPLFGETGWWIRLRSAEADWAPQLRGIFLNAAGAIQARTLDQEVLGSSTGEPNQRHFLTQSPVLPNSLELRVREILSDEEREALTRLGGESAIASYPDIAGEWVRWRRVDSFAGEDPDARAFRLDPINGEVLCGDDRHGKIPPAGRDCIRAISYRSGGGSIGNVATGTVKNVKSAVQSLEAATNPVPALGGADVPEVSVSVAAATSQLRHAGHALTPADVEAYALASAPDVVKAKWLSGNGRGFTLVMSIRRPGVRNPRLSRARREGLAAALAELGWGVLLPETIDVRGPQFVRATINATIVVSRADQLAAVEGAAHRALLDLLDPAIGPSGTGAEFGTLLCDSDVQRALRRIGSLDRVEDLRIEYPDEPGGTIRTDALVWGGEEDVHLQIKMERGR